jgi:cysteine desulfurase
VTSTEATRESPVAGQAKTAVYLDCNATTPVEPRVQTEVIHYLTEEYGNAGSRTHDFGQRAKERVVRAREQVATVVGATPDEVTFTSGATESNNLAILGLAAHGEATGRRHIVSTSIEHKAVLEPLEELERRGFEVDLVDPTAGGWVDPDEITSRVRPDTLLVSVMQANNETGVLQPLLEIAERLSPFDTFFHVDAAQGFGKDLDPLLSTRIDLISVSGHKIYGPKGIGALIARRRGFSRSPLSPLFFGGGQERGLRPGTLPVPLIAGLGLAAELSLKEHDQRTAACLRFRGRIEVALKPFRPLANGDPSHTLPHVLNVSIPGLDSEAVMLALKGVVALSNGSACTSQKYEPSHVLLAMGLPDPIVQGALRFSWCHLTEEPDWDSVQERIAALV